MLLYNKSTKRAFKVTSRMLRNIYVKSVCDHNWKPCEHEAVWEFDKCTKCGAIR